MSHNLEFPNGQPAGRILSPSGPTIANQTCEYVGGLIVSEVRLSDGQTERAIVEPSTIQAARVANQSNGQAFTMLTLEGGATLPIVGDHGELFRALLSGELDAELDDDNDGAAA